MAPDTGYLTTNDINREIAFYNYNFETTDNNIIVAVNDIIMEDVDMSFNSEDLDVFEI